MVHEFQRLGARERCVERVEQGREILIGQRRREGGIAIHAVADVLCHAPRQILQRCQRRAQAGTEAVQQPCRRDTGQRDHICQIEHDAQRQPQMPGRAGVERDEIATAGAFGRPRQFGADFRTEKGGMSQAIQNANQPHDVTRRHDNVVRRERITKQGANRAPLRQIDKHRGFGDGQQGSLAQRNGP